MRKREFEILYEAGDWVILNKPAGLPVQPGKAVRANLVDELTALWGKRPYPVHRLDRDTAGCIVVARTAAAAARAARVLADPATKKIYLAVVRGVPVPPAGEIRENILVHGVQKSAVTRYSVRHSIGSVGEASRMEALHMGSAPSALHGSRGVSTSCSDRFSLLELRLDSGRMHQIRIHLAGLGHPVLGDDLHGDFALNKALRKEGVKRLMLFAWRLELAGGVIVTAPYPGHWRGWHGLGLTEENFFGGAE